MVLLVLLYKYSFMLERVQNKFLNIYTGNSTASIHFTYTLVEQIESARKVSRGLLHDKIAAR